MTIDIDALQELESIAPEGAAGAGTCTVSCTTSCMPYSCDSTFV